MFSVLSDVIGLGCKFELRFRRGWGIFNSMIYCFSICDETLVLHEFRYE